MSDRALRATFFIALAVAHAVLLVVHEPWRDEVEGWSLVTGADSLVDVVRRLRFQGHPTAWYLVAWPVAAVSPSIEALKVLQWCIVTTTSALLLFGCGLSRSRALMLCCGYFLFFEYGVVCRLYALSALLVVAAAAALRGGPTRPVTFAVLVALLANTTIYAAPVALWFVLRARRADMWSRPGRGVALGVLGAGAALLVASLSSAATIAQRAGLAATLLRMPADALALTAPLPPARVDFWSDLLLLEQPAALVVALALLAAVAIVVFVAFDPLDVAGVALSVLTVWIVFYASGAGTLRHVGLTFLLMIAAVVVGDARPWPGGVGATLSRYVDVVRTSILGVHVLACALTVAQAARVPFSMAKATGAYIVERGGADRTWCLQSDVCVAVGAFVGAPLTMLGIGATTWIDRSPSAQEAIARRDDAAELARLARDVPGALLITREDLGPRATTRGDAPVVLHRAAAFTGSASGDDYYVYSIAGR